MKKILLLFLLFTVSLFADFKVASWNLKNVSLNSLMFKKSIFEINEYIKSNSDFDVICLQELRDRSIIYFLSGGVKEILFSPFSRYTSSYKGQGTHKEVYGFLVNKKYKDVKRVEFDNYKEFKRPPMALILNKKLAIINIHIVYGKTIKERKREVKNLLKIVETLNKKYKIAKKDIIIAGDFNLSYKNMRRVFKDATIYIDEKTTVGKKSFSKDYDHFVSYRKDGVGRVREDMVKDFTFFRKYLSDHIPIELVFKD